MKKAIINYWVTQDPGACTRCRRCIEVCRPGAITVAARRRRGGRQDPRPPETPPAAALPHDGGPQSDALGATPARAERAS